MVSRKLVSVNSGIVVSVGEMVRWYVLIGIVVVGMLFVRKRNVVVLLMVMKMGFLNMVVMSRRRS